MLETSKRPVAGSRSNIDIAINQQKSISGMLGKISMSRFDSVGQISLSVST